MLCYSNGTDNLIKFTIEAGLTEPVETSQFVLTTHYGIR